MGWVDPWGLSKGKVTNGKKYGPHEKGPLGDPNIKSTPASNFRGGSYTKKVAETDMYFVRDHGGKASAIGRYMTDLPSQGPLQSRIDSAILPEWGNTLEHQSVIKVPKGTTYYEGFAAPQTGTTGTHHSLMGGGRQIYIEEVDPSWIMKK